MTTPVKSSQAQTKVIELDDNERTRCEIWSRVMGYHRPINEWNIGKQQEHADRKHFVESAIKFI
jgi:hypothetical protein